MMMVVAGGRGADDRCRHVLRAPGRSPGLARECGRGARECERLRAFRSRWAAETSVFETLPGPIGSEVDARGRWRSPNGFRPPGSCSMATIEQHYQAILKGHGIRLLVIDDYGHAGHYHADLVLNQNLHASERCTPSESRARAASWHAILLLRREFMAWRAGSAPSPRSAQGVSPHARRCRSG